MLLKLGGGDGPYILFQIWPATVQPSLGEAKLDKASRRGKGKPTARAAPAAPKVPLGGLNAGQGTCARGFTARACGRLG